MSTLGLHMHIYSFAWLLQIIFTRAEFCIPSNFLFYSSVFDISFNSCIVSLSFKHDCNWSQYSSDSAGQTNSQTTFLYKSYFFTKPGERIKFCHFLGFQENIIKFQMFPVEGMAWHLCIYDKVVLFTLVSEITMLATWMSFSQLCLFSFQIFLPKKSEQ